MIREIKGQELEPVLKFLKGIEDKRDKSNDSKVLDFALSLVIDAKAKEVPCFGNEAKRYEGTYNDAKVEISYYEAGCGFGPFISLAFALGEVYHADVRNRAHYATEKLTSCSIDFEDKDPQDRTGSAIPNRLTMKKGELCARFDGYYQVTSASDLLAYAYNYLINSTNPYGSKFINKMLKGKGYAKLLLGW